MKMRMKIRKRKEEVICKKKREGIKRMRRKIKREGRQKGRKR